MAAQIGVDIVISMHGAEGLQQAVAQLREAAGGFKEALQSTTKEGTRPAAKATKKLSDETKNLSKEVSEGWLKLRKQYLLMRPFQSVIQGLMMTMSGLRGNVTGLGYSFMFLGMGIPPITLAVAALSAALGGLTVSIQRGVAGIEKLMRYAWGMVGVHGEVALVMNRTRLEAMKLGRTIDEVAEAERELMYHGLLVPELFEATANLAAAQGISMREAAAIITAAIGDEKSNLESLRKVGIRVSRDLIESKNREVVAYGVAAAINAKYADAARYHAQTISGAWQTIRTALSSTLQVMVEPIWDEFLRPALAAVARFLSLLFGVAKALWATAEVQTFWAETMAMARGIIEEYREELYLLGSVIIASVSVALWLLLRFVRLLIQGFGLLLKIVRWLSSHFKVLGKILKPVQDMLRMLFPKDLQINVRTIWANLKDAITNMWANLREEWENFKDKVVAYFKDKVVKVKAFLKAVWEFLKLPPGEMWEKIKEWAKETAEDLRTRIEEWFNRKLAGEPITIDLGGLLTDIEVTIDPQVIWNKMRGSVENAVSFLKGKIIGVFSGMGIDVASLIQVAGFVKLFAGIGSLAGPKGTLVGAILGAAIVTGMLMYVNRDKMAALFDENIVSAAEDASPAVASSFAETSGSIDSTFAGIGSTISNWLAGTGSSISTWATNVSDAISPFINQIKGPFLGVLGSLVNLFEAWVGWLEFLWEIAKALGEPLGEILGLFGDLADIFWLLVDIAIADHFRNVRQVVEPLALFIRDTLIIALDGLNDTLTSTVAPALSSIWDWFSSLLDKIAELITSLKESLAPALEWFKDKILDPFANAIRTVRNLLSGVKDALRKAAEAIRKSPLPIPRVPGVEARTEGYSEFQHGGAGIVRKPTLFLAGEAGPEAFMFQPLNRPASPAMALATGGGRVVIHLDIHGNTFLGTGSVDEVADIISQRIMRRVSHSMPIAMVR